ncbi:putative rubber elongation factor [Lupinus albus]|uniref:Putative rubber elongation factor n=1 Tax=Lupinus albus TaxID=3870 RepID=A0A6A4P927_LUPAL|nr:putative rubber elongation factor [Lupinus albus]
MHAATMEPVMRGAAAYGYVKERFGPLRPAVLTVEETIKSVIGRLYDKFHLVPDEILRYADHKLDDSVTAVHRVPVAERTTVSEIVKTVYSKYEPEAKKLYERYEPMAKELYLRYELKVEQCAVSAWWRVTGLPLFPTVVDVVLPKAAYCTEKYNKMIVATAERGCGISAYLP